MFTGIIEGTGRVDGASRSDDELRLRVAASFLGSPRRGESIAVDGVCLTVTRSGRGWFEALASPETVSKTTLALRMKGDEVNLERPVGLGDPLGGHLVQGHVDGVGVVESVRREGSGTRMRIGVPGRLRDYVIEKGSIAVDGTSLTIAACGDGWIEVAVIPETLRITKARAYAAGAPVNLEVDMMGRYVVECVKRQNSAPARAGSVTRDLLARHGFGSGSGRVS